LLSVPSEHAVLEHVHSKVVNLTNPFNQDSATIIVGFAVVHGERIKERPVRQVATVSDLGHGNIVVDKIGKASRYKDALAEFDPL
jgi:hypothetical protein